MKKLLLQLSVNTVTALILLIPITLIGQYLFGPEFWNGQFDKWDYGVYCGFVLFMAFDITDNVIDYFWKEK